MAWRFYPTSEYWPTDSSGRRKPAKYVGRTTRMGVEQYQDYTLFINEDVGTRRGRYLTDPQLCADWQHEFPDAVTFLPFHVEGVRRDYNKGLKRRPDGGSSHGVRGADGEVSGPGSSRPHSG